MGGKAPENDGAPAGALRKRGGSAEESAAEALRGRLGMRCGSAADALRKRLAKRLEIAAEALRKRLGMRSGCAAEALRERCGSAGGSAAGAPREHFGSVAAAVGKRYGGQRSNPAGANPVDGLPLVCSPCSRRQRPRQRTDNELAMNCHELPMSCQ